MQQQLSEYEVLVALAAGTATETHLNQLVSIDGSVIPVRDFTQAQILALRDRNAF